MNRYKVETDRGMTIVKANSIEEAKEIALRDFGRFGFAKLQIATQEDIEWYLAMGGNKDNV